MTKNEKKGDFTRWLPVKLTDEETMKKAQEMSHKLDERDTIEAEKAEATRGYGEKLKKLAGEISGIAKCIRMGEEHRHVQCVEKRDLGKKRIYTVRLDTGETIDERAIRGEDLQEKMELEKDDGKDGTFGEVLRAAVKDGTPEKPVKAGKRVKEPLEQTWPPKPKDAPRKRGATARGAL